jgi:aryl sulfotransferase
MPELRRAPTRAVRSRVFDSARWEGYRARRDDVIIATYSKCGTTWMQRIVSMLLFQSAAPQPIWDLSPWFDMRLFGPIEAAIAKAEAQSHRRFLKTHLPMDSLPIYEGVKVIHVARDGRDAAMSLHNHLANFTPTTLADLNAISRADPKFGDSYPETPQDPALFFSQWIHDGGGQGDAGAGFYCVENSYWNERSHEDVLLVHYNDLKTDRAGEMRRIAAFLGIETPESVWKDLVAAAGFEAMKQQGAELIPAAAQLWNEGASRFMNKGTNGRWKSVVSDEDLRRYEERVKAHFAPELARWLQHGRIIAGDPSGQVSR